MKLEEHRRHILQEKRKMEFALSRQQQKVGKAAFFQAINKVSSLCFWGISLPLFIISIYFIVSLSFVFVFYFW